MPFNTALTRKLGIRGQKCIHPIMAHLLTDVAVPVVQGGMQWVGYAELASAVSNAGGLGIVLLTSADVLHKPVTLTWRRRSPL